MLNDFIEEHKTIIYEKIVQHEEHVTEAKGMKGDGETLCAANAMFIAETLALMSGIVSVGTNKENFQAAKDWIKEKLPNAEDPTPVFLSLTLIYVIEKGWADAAASQDEERKAIWYKIHNRMKGFSQSVDDGRHDVKDEM